MDNSTHPVSSSVPVKEISRLFLKLGLIGFGGPAAHIAMMRREVVEERKWMDEQHFLDLLGAVNLIPGPNSTEMAIHIGYDKAGRKGLLAAGFCFIMPAVIITGILAELYRSYGQLPEVTPFLYGIKPAVAAVIAGAVYPIAKNALKSTFLTLTALAVFSGSLSGICEIYLLFGSGIAAYLLYAIKNNSTKKLGAITPIGLIPAAGNLLLSSLNARLFFIFLKIGAVLYGSGYVLFALLDRELVQTGLMNSLQLADAIAVGQFTPGPVFSSVTFIGWQINGFPGAFFSTLAVFMPSFLFIAMLMPLMKIARRSKSFSVFLDAVNAASAALVAAMFLKMAIQEASDWRTVFILFLSMFCVFKLKKINTAAIILGSSAAGFLLKLL
ncbi:chromate efflux transporter [Flavobacterium sp. HJSW_4]|uniref:chromate efflux transporter n=1 Tax=Flavobacterium sp. HJSW_4 TaxID=3344660 RepID=UPI0035F4DC9E